MRFVQLHTHVRYAEDGSAIDSDLLALDDRGDVWCYSMPFIMEGELQPGFWAVYDRGATKALRDEHDHTPKARPSASAKHLGQTR